MQVCVYKSVLLTQSSQSVSIFLNHTQILVAVISPDLQMLPRILNALCAFLILDNTFSSVSPVMFMTLPKYVKDVTSLMSYYFIDGDAFM